MKKRCDWVTDDKVYIEYHDSQWGVPVYDDKLLFEMLILEGSQAGLSWLTILKRRENYRKAYDGFNPEKMAKWTDKKIAQLLQDPGIIRNKLKITAARQNAKAYLEVVREHGSFKEFIWSFVSGKPIINNWKTISDIPVITKESDAMSKELKKKGFKFVGSTICYAFMQAVGMVNDHIVSCHRYKMSTPKFEEQVWELCRKIPKGKVTTYKEIARAMNTKAYRLVGRALKLNPYAPEVPCHRVVTSCGGLGGYQGKLNNAKKNKLLLDEGVKIKNGKIVDFDSVFYQY